jgi:hypothetical protein
MFDLETRKNNTNNLLDFLTKILKIFSDKPEISGLLVFTFHWLCLGIPLIQIGVGKINNLFYLSCFVWILIFIFHIYFNGCILTRLERKLWDTNEWYGPWCFLFKTVELYYDNNKISRNFANNTFYCWGIFLSIYAIVRVLYHTR